jgi:hypothetical protein
MNLVDDWCFRSYKFIYTTESSQVAAFNIFAEAQTGHIRGSDGIMARDRLELSAKLPSSK